MSSGLKIREELKAAILGQYDRERASIEEFTRLILNLCQDLSRDVKIHSITGRTKEKPSLAHGLANSMHITNN